ncbi:hypothetical protein [Mesorhizobium sp.]|nr:hypothetical protein [Mesorhizobium sp.]
MRMPLLFIPLLLAPIVSHAADIHDAAMMSQQSRRRSIRALM